MNYFYDYCSVLPLDVATFFCIQIQKFKFCKSLTQKVYPKQDFMTWPSIIVYSMLLRQHATTWRWPHLFYMNLGFFSIVREFSKCLFKETFSFFLAIATVGRTLTKILLQASRSTSRDVFQSYIAKAKRYKYFL